MSQHWRQSRGAPQAVIMVVDDSRLNRELLISALLPRQEYRFLECENGRQAVDILQAGVEVDLILLDLMMPVMDGFEFLRWRQEHLAIQEIPVIVNSSLDDAASLSSALEMDCYGYFVKPLRENELKLVLPLKIRNAVNARRMLARLRQANQRMAQELNMAARYQSFLLPQPLEASGVEAAWLFKPCRELGGDYFDFFPLPGGDLGMVVADVAGHGVASAMTASILKALLPGYLERTHSPAETLSALNDDLLNLTEEDSYVTAFLGLYHLPERTLSWCSAGHPPPLCLPVNGPARLLSHPGFLLGVFSSQSPLVSFEDKQFELGLGHRLVLYTDGLTEAENDQGGRLGINGLENMAAAARDLPPQEFVDQLERELDHYSQGSHTDDVALIAMDF
ncbi:MAG: SpoIIE family protein phosphatase [Desulfarculaceae bacterium]|nr:SpoIIE family protein phosphatase [Desulfarculaceae bacterium]MCF8072329.1 SpoIIE family protein phosphatase [Desulfarculaceae bacterium]MCF8100250.1 SpoIIE family protein phosphatase [Desulfarculaceae bacterium]MCF8116177.1 SpoIIE family protein phosphatase [Desulfarculaceae bacterium]